jgi:threonine-phosphate decarboxylase
MWGWAFVSRGVIVARMTADGHGGDVYAASRELHRDLDQLIDFSASINPLGPSPAVWRSITQSRHFLQHYPDPECWALRQVLASRWRRLPDHIVVGNGSSELIHALPRALGLCHLLVIGPTFSEYADAMTRSGGNITMVLAEREEDYAPPLDHALRLMKLSRRSRQARHAIDGVVLCNPNSPTGQACEADAVMQVARAAERHRLWMIIDETFADYCEGTSILSQATALTRVIVLRSLTKFYGIPGLRVGYAVSQAKVARQLRRQQPPWSVNAFAQIAAVAALKDAGHAQRSLSFMARERARFMALLAELPGCVVFPSHANFILMELPVGRHAKNVTARLRREGLLIRDCSVMPGLHSRSVRVAVRTKRENDLLVKALSGLLGHQ